MPQAGDFISLQRVEVERIVDLRHRILRAGLERETAIFAGDHDPESVHLVALDAWDMPVGCCSLHRKPWLDRDAWQLRGMAVEQAWRGMGVGTRLLIEIECIVLDDGTTQQLWCNARKPAVGFYERHGWQLASPEFDIPTAGPHHKMTRTATGRW